MSIEKVTSTQEMTKISNAKKREIYVEISPKERYTDIMPIRGIQSTTGARSCLTSKSTSKCVTRRRAKRADYVNAQNLFGKDRGALHRKLLVVEDESSGRGL